jgi:hypothetical protein
MFARTFGYQPEFRRNIRADWPADRYDRQKRFFGNACDRWLRQKHGNNTTESDRGFF